MDDSIEWSELKYLPSDVYKIMKKPTWYLKDLLNEKRIFDNITNSINKDFTQGKPLKFKNYTTMENYETVSSVRSKTVKIKKHRKMRATVNSSQLSTHHHNYAGAQNSHNNHHHSYLQSTHNNHLKMKHSIQDMLKRKLT